MSVLDEAKLTWTAYCLTCKSKVAEWKNGAMVEEAAKMHIMQRNHDEIIVGLVYTKEDI